MSSGLRPRITCGWLTHGRLLWTRTIPGPRPSGRLRLSKFNPVEFVFARAKTILPGAKLGAHSAPAGPAPGMARAKSNQKKHTPAPPTPSCASRRPSARAPTRRAHAPGARRSAARPFGGMEVHRTSMNTPPYPRARTRSRLKAPSGAAVLDARYGDPKTPSATVYGCSCSGASCGVYG